MDRGCCAGAGNVAGAAIDNDSRTGHGGNVMPTRSSYTDQQLLDYSEEHLLYELKMIRWLVEHLPTEKNFSLSASLESFAIHLRGLIDFFYAPPDMARADDLIASDFFDSPNSWKPGAIPKSLTDARERTNKEIGHITYKRKDATDPTKPWPVADLFKEVHAIAQRFAALASTKKLHPSVKTWLGADDAMTISFLASTTTSNVAVSVISGGASSSAKRAP